MALKKEAQEVIQALENGRFRAECPHCSEGFPLERAGLFYLDDFTPAARDLYAQRMAELKDRAKELKEARKKVPQRAETTTRAVNLGFILERLAPTMPGFRFHRNDCRSLFDPIDYIVFEGLSRRGMVERIIFADIKTGGARLVAKQQEIKALIELGKVECDLYDAEAANEE